LRLEPGLGDGRSEEVVLLGLDVAEPFDEHREGRDRRIAVVKRSVVRTSTATDARPLEFTPASW